MARQPRPQVAAYRFTPCRYPRMDQHLAEHLLGAARLGAVPANGTSAPKHVPVSPIWMCLIVAQPTLQPRPACQNPCSSISLSRRSIIKVCLFPFQRALKYVSMVLSTP